MSGAQIREKLHQYIDQADDRLINLMYAMVQADRSEVDYEISDEHKSILDKRLASHLAEPSSGSDWEEVKTRLKDQL